MFEIETTDIFDKWFKKLHDNVAKTRIALRLVHIRQGTLGDTKSIDSGLFEARIHYGPGYRIYFMSRNNMIIILLCGGDKTSQDKDIKLAKQLAKEN